MENSLPSLIPGDAGDGTSRVTESLLSPSSAHHHPSSESSHQSHGHTQSSPWDRELHPKRRLRERSSLIDALRQRFPDGPPTTYDQFISVSLNDVPPNEMLAINPRVSREITTQVSPLKRMASKIWATVIGGMNTRPPLPLYNKRPVISHPKPIRQGSIHTPRLSPSPVQMYTDNFVGIGPPPPLPSPTDVIDIQPPSRNAATTSESSHYSQPTTENVKYRALTEAMGPSLAPPAVPNLARIQSKNSIVFPTVKGNRQKNLRIITPHASIYNTEPVTTPIQKSRQSSSFASIFAYIARIIQFRDPAESIFVLGFLFGPQTWLIGGWYVASVDKRDRKSQLRIWSDKEAGRKGDKPRYRSLEQARMLLERIDRASSGLTSESFEVGRRTATNSNASRAILDAIPSQQVEPPTSREHVAETNLEGLPAQVIPLKSQRPSRAVWAGSIPPRARAGGLLTYDNDDEVSVDFRPSKYILRCRIAASISGVVVMALFLAALVTVCKD